MKRIISLVVIMSFMNTTLLLANDYYEKAKRLYDRVEYDQSLEALEDAISREENDKKTLIEIYYLKAKIYAILGKEKEAKKQFVKLLFLNNEYKVSEDESPKIVKFFKETKKKFIESLTVKLDTPEIIFEAVRNVKYQKRIKIKALISSMNESRSAKIYYRNIGSSKYLQSDFTQTNGDNFEGNIPLPLSVDRDFALEYYIGVLDFSGKQIAHYPSAEEPLILSVTVNKKDKQDNNSTEISNDDSILNKWWFWATVGVIVVGAGAGTYFVISK
jgi:tetratricopeptide (TPR) repeat protein